MDSAASIRPKGISRMEVSTILAVYGIAAIVRGTIAAVVPMEVPATILVKGMMATIKMMNGMERTMLMANARRLIEYRANENSVLLSDYEQDAKRYSDNGCDNS